MSLEIKEKNSSDWMGEIDAEMMGTVGSHGISMGYKISGHDVSLVHQLWDVNGTTKQHWLDYILEYHGNISCFWRVYNQYPTI